MESFSHWFATNRVGIVFCGRQSPGGHNVIWGLHNALKVHNPNSILLGFLGKFSSLLDIDTFLICFLRTKLVFDAVFSYCIYASIIMFNIK